MSRRVILPAALELRSDAIFGSGCSIPGGEDVAVCRDERGYPYIKGSTWKGLLRESLENLAAWDAVSSGDADALLGEEGWSGLADGRRVRLTALTLDSPPEDPEDCFDQRTFTSLDGGVVKQGTLRTAACVRKGLVFSGQIHCEEEDAELLCAALSGVKWAGTMRSRGFGRVTFRTGEVHPLAEGAPLSAGTCVRFRLHTELPVMITDQNRSTGTFYDSNDNNQNDRKDLQNHRRGSSYETQGFIPGSALRGAVMGRLAARDPQWFEAHKTALLSDGVRFLDAVPVLSPLPPLPAIRGFYEDKEGTKFENVVINGQFTPGLKRASLGGFCALDGDTVRYWSARTGGTTRIQRGKDGRDTSPFQVRYLSAGQDFEGYVLLDDPELTPAVSQALGGTLWLGADRYAGFGKCRVTALEGAESPAWAAYGFRDGEQPGTDLYLLAVSPFTMVDKTGNPCGLDLDALAQMLGVDRVKLAHCSTALTQAGGYNRVWQCRAPSVRMYDRGSLFHLTCAQPPALDALRRVEAQGLGVRRSEGFGQVLFLPPERIDSLKAKRAVEKTGGPAADRQAAQLRRARYRWIMDQAGVLTFFGLSKSQLGTVQVLCEKAIANGGDWSELDQHLTHNLEGRGAVHGERFKKIDRLVREVLSRPLGGTLNVDGCQDSPRARLELLCLLFDHSRKGGKEE